MRVMICLLALSLFFVSCGKKEKKIEFTLHAIASADMEINSVDQVIYLKNIKNGQDEKVEKNKDWNINVSCYSAIGSDVTDIQYGFSEVDNNYLNLNTEEKQLKSLSKNRSLDDIFGKWEVSGSKRKEYKDGHAIINSIYEFTKDGKFLLHVYCNFSFHK